MSAVEGLGEPGSAEATQALGRQLRRLRESAQLTQEVMVKLHGGSKTSISRYENGDRIPRTSRHASTHGMCRAAERQSRIPHRGRSRRHGRLFRNSGGTRRILQTPRRGRGQIRLNATVWELPPG
ncbi:helix-turn-helix transcriptional regulator [Streptomyces sp. NPDC095817]|uniref:helix-turn-helix domain-containing protein n=1 Tax=Streptomyces sp. NPDC095817 TaxID=3155082 RepID=UPI00332ED5C8